MSNKSRIVKFDSPFTFKDGLETARKQNMTLDELFYRSQLIFDSDKAEVSITDALIEYHDAVLNDGIEKKYAYNGFTVLDENIRRPGFNTFALKHVPHIYGGGAVETDKGFFAKETTVEGRLASGNNNKVNLVNYDSETLEAPIVPITLGLSIGFIDKMKSDHIGFDVIEAHHGAVAKSYQIELDKFAFVGHKGTGINNDQAKGLLNFDNGDAIYRDIETDYTLDTKVLEEMTTPELLAVISNEYSADASLKVYDPLFMANKLLVYPKFLASLTKPAHITLAGTVYKSQLAVLLETLNTLSSSFGGPEVAVDFVPYTNPRDELGNFDPILNEPGVNGTGRLVLYRQDPYILRTRIALDLTPGALVLDIVNNQIRRNYVAFIGVPLLFYPGHIRYIDNGTTVKEQVDE